MRDRLLWIALITAGACGDDAGAGDVAVDAASDGDGVIDAPPGAFPEETSGTRLKIRWHVGGDVRIRDGIVDTGLDGTDCRATEWNDGVVRCTPGGASTVYLDEDCTQPAGIGYQTTCDGPPAFVTTYAGTTCSTVVTAVYRRGAALPNTSFHYATSLGCSGAMTLETDARLYSLDAPVAASELVGLAAERVSAGDRLDVSVLRGADGSVFRERPYDKVAGAACMPFAQRDAATGVCYLAAIAGGAYFSDTTCSVPVAVDQRQCTATPTVAVEYGRRQCPGGGEEEAMIYRLGPELPGDVDLYGDGDATCELMPDIEGPKYPRTGEPFLQSVTANVPEGAGPLQRLTVRDGVATVAVEGFYDPALQSECSPLVASDGVLRCAAMRTAEVYFRDAACTQAVAAIRVYTGPSDCPALEAPKSGVIYRVDPDDACASLADVYRGGAELTGPFFQGRGDTCMPAIAENAKFYAATLVPPGELPVITTAVDP